MLRKLRWLSLPVPTVPECQVPLRALVPVRTWPNPVLYHLHPRIRTGVLGEQLSFHLTEAVRRRLGAGTLRQTLS